MIRASNLPLFMRGVLAASFAKFLQVEFFLDFFLIAVGVVVHFLANLAFQSDEIVLRHKII
jgi:hypothetical protein